MDDAEGARLWSIMEAANDELLVCDPSYQCKEDDVRNIQADVLGRVSDQMEENGSSEVGPLERDFIRARVRVMVHAILFPVTLRYAKLDRVVCRIGGARGWAAGSVQALNEEDPSDPTGQTNLPYVVKIDPPDSRLVSVPKDTNEYVRAEICFGQRDGALWFTRMCLPKAVRKGAMKRSRPRRFAVGDRVACAVEDASDDYTDWAAGTVLAVDHVVEGEDGVSGGFAAYQVKLDSGGQVLVHVDEHWLVRSLALQPVGPRVAADGTRFVQRLSKRRTEDGRIHIDHMTCKVRKLASDTDSDDDDDSD